MYPHDSAVADDPPSLFVCSNVSSDSAMLPSLVLDTDSNTDSVPSLYMDSDVCSDSFPDSGHGYAYFEDRPPVTDSDDTFDEDVSPLPVQFLFVDGTRL